MDIDSLPWCVFDDFNKIVGDHEYRGSRNLVRFPIEEFQNWKDTGNLVHLPTRSVFYTWDNGWRGLDFTQKRLDKEMVNHMCIDMCLDISCNTLTREKSLTVSL